MPEHVVVEQSHGQFAVVVQIVAVGLQVVIAASLCVLGLRVDSEAEETGLDIAVHGETAYVPWSGQAGAMSLSESVVGTDASGGTRNLSATEAKPA